MKGRRIDPVPALGLVFALVMALPYLWFGFDAGWKNYCDVAPDQSFYLLDIVSRGAAWNQQPINAINHWIWALSAGSETVYFLVSTLLFSLAAFLGATFLARAFSRSAGFTVLAVALLLFPAELLSFRYQEGFFSALSIHPLVAAWPLAWRQWFSDSVLSYLQLARLPEPATTLWVFLFYAACMIRLTLDRERAGQGLRIAALVFAGLLGVGYPFFAASGVMLAALLYAVESIDERRLRPRFSLLVLVVLLAVGATTQWLSHRVEAHAFLYSSRLPLFSLSYLWGAVLAASAWRLRRRMASTRHVAFAMLSAMLPVVVMNQQVVTGIMIQALNWERYVNYTYIAFSLLAILPALSFAMPRGIRQLGRKGVGVLVCAGYALLVYLQLCGYRDYWYYNVESVALASALRQAYRAGPALPRDVILADMTLDEQVRPRLRTLPLSIHGYASIVHSIGRADQVARNRQRGFAYAFYQGLSPRQFAGALQTEIHEQTCWPNTMYFFEFLRCAPYMSDFRKYDPSRLSARVPELRREYAGFVRRDAGSLPPVLFVTLAPLHDAAGTPMRRALVFRRDYDFRSRFGAAPQRISVYGYRETPSEGAADRVRGGGKPGN